jgi:DNA-binding GntR family transcriptional regulator
VVLVHGGARANAEHRAIATAAGDQDVNTACQLMRDHILGAGSSLLTLLHEQRGGNGGAAPSLRR